jgi:hypothetical protein
MFRALPPFAPTDAALKALADSMADAPGAAGDNPDIPSGYTYLGQFVDHDITFDPVSSLDRVNDPDALITFRTPRFDLDSLYGRGQADSPYLYDQEDPASLLVGRNTGPENEPVDVPRNQQGRALIGDPRNDVHFIVSQLHLAFIRFHNAVVDHLRFEVEPAELFDEARRVVTWHYQWVVVHDFLPRLVGRPLVSEVLRDGGRWYAPALGQAFLPLEFADAAYRYGHGQIRHAYRLRAGTQALPLFPDLVGFRPVPPEHRIELDQIFDLPGRPPAQRSKRLDGGLPASLLGLPHQVTGDVPDGAYRSLAVRDLLRGGATGLPSGEAVAAELGVSSLSTDEVGPGWQDGTPLWFYILKEAEHRGAGDRLGPVGGRIVTEVLIGLIRADSHSWLAVDPSWQPTLPHAGAGFTLADLLLFADAERTGRRTATPQRFAQM